MAEKAKKNKLKLKIKFEGFTLDVSSDNPDKTLYELNKLIKTKKEFLETLNPPEIFEFPQSFEDEDLGFEFKARVLTGELRCNNEIMDSIRNLTLKHGDFAYRKERMEIKQEVDLDNKSLRMVVEKKEIDKMITKLLFDMDAGSISHVIVHVIGEILTSDQKLGILDEIKRKTGFAETTFLFTKKKIPGALVSEAILFGDFPKPKEDY